MFLTGDETGKVLHFCLVPRVLIHSFNYYVVILAKFILALSLFKLPFHVFLILSRIFCSIFLLKCSDPN